MADKNDDLTAGGVATIFAIVAGIGLAVASGCVVTNISTDCMMVSKAAHADRIVTTRVFGLSVAQCVVE